MKQILWFRRDLRIFDSALLANAQQSVFPIFIFDKNILETLPKNDTRVTFIYQSVLKLKAELQSIGLDLAIFYGNPKEIFQSLQLNQYDEVLCSCDFESYGIKRDKEVETLLPMKRFYDSFLLNPEDGLKEDGKPYKVFTPFYKNLRFLWESDSLVEYTTTQKLQKIEYDYSYIPTLEELGFIQQQLPSFLTKNAEQLIEEFKDKLYSYQENRDYFYRDDTSKLSVHLRFGLISPRQVFNKIKQYSQSEFFIRELFWREFYNYILHHYPESEFENFNGKNIPWRLSQKDFEAWCEGNTGVPLIDAAMRHLNETGEMHNRLRMIVASFFTKNLFLPWQWGEKYFAQKLLDYELSSNVGSWQWSASTGADSVPYFRVFNPYSQSEKFDKNGIFIKSVIKEFQDMPSSLFHKENKVQSNLFIDYPYSIVDIKKSREYAIEIFKKYN